MFNMGLEQDDRTTSTVFRHSPLDHTIAAIRLIRLLPELSPDGLIQCTITHDTVEASYTCLSYRWGAPTPSNPIIINGKLFEVRQNLLDFLHMARRNNEAANIFWIDALCIDQANTAEKNHQVTQMGRVYASAAGVYLWLGANPGLAPALHILRDPEAATPQQWSVIQANQSALEEYLCSNEYWTRAWILQEIFLAHTVTVWANEETLLFEHLHWAIDYFYLAWRNRPIQRFQLSRRGSVDPRRLTSTFAEAKSLYHGASLASLLAHFYDMKCEIRRDRIFSLLALSADAQSYQVDYGCADIDVCIDILNHCESSLCICTPSLFAHSIGLGDDFMDADTQTDELCPFLEVEIPNMAFSKTFESFHLSGSAYIVRKLDIDWEFYTSMSGKLEEPPCQNFIRMLRHVSHTQVVRVDNNFIQNNQRYLQGPFRGRISEPDDHTLSSYLQKHGEMWISNSYRGDAYRHVPGFTIQEVSRGICVLRLPFSILLSRFSFSSQMCNKIGLGKGSDDRTTGKVKIQVKHGCWNVKTTLTAQCEV
jgi:hypothetical protein